LSAFRRRIAVFCSSSPGNDPGFAAAARELGACLAAEGRELVYGGGRVGLMGELADAVLAAGGRVTGVIPEALLAREVAHQGLTELHVVASMHARKAGMADLSDAFVALPGGFGTLDELFEIVTWAQLGLHARPIGLLDVNGYFGALRAFVARAVADALVRPEHRDLLIVDTSPAPLLARLDAHVPGHVPK
jgi:uncharacterized protein (TIGR00730 family)